MEDGFYFGVLNTLNIKAKGKQLPCCSLDFLENIYINFAFYEVKDYNGDCRILNVLTLHARLSASK